MARNFEYEDTNNKYVDSVSVSATPVTYDNLEASVNDNFTFLTNDLQTKLDEVMKEIEDTLSIDAFVFDSVTDLSKAKEELEQLVSTIKSDLDALHSSFETDVGNVMTEVDNNFKWAKQCVVSVSSVSTTPKNPASSGTTTP